MTDKINWVLIPPTVLDDSRLSSTDKMVYGKVLGLSNQKGYCFASNDYLADGLGVSKDSVKKSLQKMYKLGILRYELKMGKNKQVEERHIYPVMGVGEIFRIGGGKGRGNISPESLYKEIKEDNANSISDKRLEEIRAEIYRKIGKPI